MHREFHNKGVVVMALTEEPTETVKKFLKKYTEEANKPSENPADVKGEVFEFNYLIGMNAGRTSRAYRIKAYPTLLVVDTKNRITYRGHNFDDAKKVIERLLRDEPPKDALPLIEAAAKKIYRKAVSYAKKKKFAKALEKFDECAEKFKDTTYGKKSAAGAKKIRGSKKMMVHVEGSEADKECEEWLQLARSCAEAGRKNAAAHYYDKIIKKYPESKQAKIAKEEKAKLEYRITVL